MAIVWTERIPLGAAGQRWRMVDNDSDGSNIIVASETKKICTSADFGATWSLRDPWVDPFGCASDDDGTNLMFITDNGAGSGVYLSVNGGGLFVNTPPVGGDLEWPCCASDGDGSNLMVCRTGGPLYLTANGGGLWVATQGGANRAWSDVDSDADGSHLVACVNGGLLYTTANGGTVWDTRTPVGGVQNYHCVGISADGSCVVAGITGGRLWFSDDNGVSWSEIRPKGDANGNWWSGAISGDGLAILVGEVGGRLYFSPDQGASWTEELPAGVVDEDWYGTALDDDGSHMVAAWRIGRLYTAVRDMPPTITLINPAADQVGNPVTITGTNFGAAQGGSSVTFFNGVDAGVAISWSAIQIVIDVPVGAATGDVIVTVGGLPSAGEPFTVLPAPTPAPPGPGGWIVSGWDSTDPAGTPHSGRIVGDDGQVYNYDESGVLVPVAGLIVDVPIHITGRYKREDSTNTNIADDLERRS